ncbi:MAG TPA: hypothetical protein V6C85_25085 [Allocoleopsis sp.]
MLFAPWLREIEFVVDSVALATCYTRSRPLGELAQQRFRPVVQFFLPSLDIETLRVGQE